ncbi:hypothetical protein SALBM135S_07560 [Streptomyces alboniger]
MPRAMPGGKDAGSGRPGRRSCAGDAGLAGAGFGTRVRRGGAARSATRVPEPWRAVSQPSAD